MIKVKTVMIEEEILMVGIIEATETKAIELTTIETIEEIRRKTQVQIITEEIKDHIPINNDIFFGDPI